MVDHAEPVLLTIAIGNSRVRWGAFQGQDLLASASAPADEPTKLAAELAEHDDAGRATLVVTASVNDPAADAIEAALVAATSLDIRRVRRDLDIPIRHALDDDRTVGTDRLLNAYAAYDRAKQACVVIDAGTAITVDLVDGEGTFQGGAIAPGLKLMLAALHEHTAQLPALEFDQPVSDRGPLGKDTAHAMQLGVQASARGLVRQLLEEYAEFYGGYPQVVATGGDAPALFLQQGESDGVVEHIVPDLQLIGIQACVQAAAEAEA